MITTAELLIEKGKEYLEEEKYSQAIQTLTQAIAADPKRAEAYCRRADAYYSSLNALCGQAPPDPIRYEEFETLVRGREELVLSMDDLRTALAIDPEFPDAHFGMGVVLYELGRYLNALKSFNRAIALKPDNPEAYYRRAMAHEQLRDDVSALGDLDAAIELNDRYADAYLERGVIFSTQDRVDDAIAQMRRAIELEPASAQYRIHLAMAIATPAYGPKDERRLREALDELAEALRLEPSRAEAYFNRALIHGAIGDFENELNDLTAALRLDRDYTIAYQHRFECLCSLGREKEAVRDWAEYCSRTKTKEAFPKPAALNFPCCSN